MGLKISIFGFYSTTKHLIDPCIKLNYDLQVFSNDAEASNTITSSHPEIHSFVSFETIDDALILKALDLFQPDYIFVASFDKKIPATICNKASTAAINFHPSLLPDYKGPDPYYWVIRNGELATGISAHIITQEWDAGDIIYQHEFKLSTIETYFSLIKRTYSEYTPMLNSMSSLLESKSLNFKKQTSGSYYSYPTANDYIIEWNRPANTIDQLIRALPINRAALTQVYSHVIKIIEVSITSSKSIQPGHVYIDNQQLFIGSNDYNLEINIVVFQDQIYSTKRFLKLLKL